VNVCRVRNDLVVRDRRGIPVFKPIETHALTDVNLIQHALIGHRPPAQRKIDWNEGRSLIPAIDFSMEDTSIEREMRERCQLIVSACHRRVGGLGLLRLGWNQDSGRIFDGSMQVIPGKYRCCEKKDEAKEFHSRLLSRFSARASLHHHSTVNTNHLAGDVICFH